MELDYFHSIFVVSISVTDVLFFFFFVFTNITHKEYFIPLSLIMPFHCQSSPVGPQNTYKKVRNACFLEVPSWSNPCWPLPHLLSSLYPSLTPPSHSSEVESQSDLRAFAHAIHPLPDPWVYDPDQNRGEPTLRLEKYPLRLTGKENSEGCGLLQRKLGLKEPKQWL